jgi:nucleoside-diphosphate-sugar epimerase
MIKKELGWEPSISLRNGLEKTYAWIFEEMQKKHSPALEEVLIG